MNEKQLRAELDAVYGSLSWRITAPLRYLSAFVRRYIFSLLSPKVWKRALVNYLLRKPSLIVFLKNALAYVPGLRFRAKSIFRRLVLDTQIEQVPVKQQLNEESQAPVLSMASSRIYRELQAAVEDRT